METTMNEVPTAVKGSATAEKQSTAPDFDVEKEYTFTMRSFRYRNNWAFCTVTQKGQNLEILIGQAADYPLPTMLQAKQFGGNVFGTFKGYPRSQWRGVSEVLECLRRLEEALRGFFYVLLLPVQIRLAHALRCFSGVFE